MFQVKLIISFINIAIGIFIDAFAMLQSSRHFALVDISIWIIIDPLAMFFVVEPFSLIDSSVLEFIDSKASVSVILPSSFVGFCFNLALDEFILQPLSWGYYLLIIVEFSLSWSLIFLPFSLIFLACCVHLHTITIFLVILPLPVIKIPIGIVNFAMPESFSVL